VVWISSIHGGGKTMLEMERGQGVYTEKYMYSVQVPELQATNDMEFGWQAKRDRRWCY
jgi:hypothetical protein